MEDRWVAIWTKPRAEKAVCAALMARNDNAWLPTIVVKRRWSDRWKEVETPLFPGYLFVQAKVGSWPTLLRIPGVLTVVKQGHRPAWIREEQMADLRAAVAHAAAFGERETPVVCDFQTGDRVRVLGGAMAGLVGVIRETRGSRWLLVGFEQIGRAIGFSIGAADVERIDSAMLEEATR